MSRPSCVDRCGFAPGQVGVWLVSLPRLGSAAPIGRCVGACGRNASPVWMGRTGRSSCSWPESQLVGREYVGRAGCAFGREEVSAA